MSHTALNTGNSAALPEKRWEDLDNPTTLYEFLTQTRSKYRDSPAVTFQLLSDPKSKAETMSWNELTQGVTQAANLFNSLGIGKNGRRRVSSAQFSGNCVGTSGWSRRRNCEPDQPLIGCRTDIRDPARFQCENTRNSQGISKIKCGATCFRSGRQSPQCSAHFGSRPE